VSPRSAQFDAEPGMASGPGTEDRPAGVASDGTEAPAHVASMASLHVTCLLF